MWKKIAPLLIVLSVGLNAAFVGVWAVRAVGSYWPTGHADDHGEIWCPLYRQLNVTEEQWRKIEPRLLEFRRKAQTVRREVNLRRGEMLDLVASPHPDRQAITAKREEILAGQRRMQQLVIEHLLAEKEGLTPEQQKEFFNVLRRRSGCVGQGPMMGPRRGMGPGAAQPDAESSKNRRHQE